MVTQAKNGYVNFKLPSNLIIKNTTLNISSIEITGGDWNETFTLTPDGYIDNIYFGTAGEKVLKFKMFLSNNTSKTTYAKITITSTSSSFPMARIASDGIDYEAEFPPCFKERFFANRLYQGFAERPGYGEGEVYYYYANSKSCNPSNNTDTINKLNVTKPIIVLDGFDPGDERGAAELYGKYLRYNPTPNTTEYLGNVMRANAPDYNYDVIILNFPNGADFIERNAFVLMELINQVNAQLTAAGSNEKITIIGPSMGGLISRYALALMEKEGLTHNTKLWVSFDSPHLGANIPIADQLYLNFVAPVSVGARDNLEKKINSPAAKQMLLHHHLSGQDAVTGAPNYRQHFINVLENNGLPNTQGFPSNAIRKIALINGSQNGALQPGSPCGTAFDFELKKTFLSRVGIRLFFGILSGFISPGPVIMEANVSFAPGANNNCVVLAGRSHTVGFPKDTFKHAQAINAGASIDLAPGSTHDTQGIIRDEGKDVGYGALVKTKFENVIETHTFIPAKSALAFKWNNQANIGDWGENLTNRNLVCTGEIPFDAYYAPSQNEAHVFLTQAGVDFIINEIKGTYVEPTYSPYITGMRDFCHQSTFTVQDVPPGASIVWSFLENDNDFTFTSSNTGNTVTVATNPGGDAMDDLIATITTTCKGVPKIYEAVSYLYGAELPEFNDIIEGPSMFVSGYGEQYFLEPVEGATNYEWYAVGGGMTFTDLNPEGNLVHANTPWSGNYDIGVIVTLPCGTLYAEEKQITAYSYRYSIASNTETGSIEVTAVSSSTMDQREQELLKNAEVKLINKFGKGIASYRFTDNIANIRTKGLPNDLYIIQVSDAKGIFSKQVVIQN